MRTTRSTILAGVAAFLLALAAMLRFYAFPQLEKQPLDFYFNEVATGQGTYFDVGSLSMKGPEQLTAMRTYRGDVKAGTDNVAVWDVFTKLQNSQGKLIDAFTERWAFDRKTGRSVHGYGEQPPHTGYFVVWPFNAPKRGFPVWDQTTKSEWPSRYAGTQQLQGHTVQRYVATIPPTKISSIDLPGSLVGSAAPSIKVDEFYSNDNYVVLVEPRTGAAVGGSSHQKRTLRPAGGTEDIMTVLDVNLQVTPKSTKELLDKADNGAMKLDLIGVWLPLAALVIGLGLLALVLVLEVRPRTVVLPGAAGAPAEPAPESAQPVPATAPRPGRDDQQPPY